MVHLIFSVVKCVILSTPWILLCSFWEALRVCFVSWQDWGAGGSHQSPALAEELQVNLRVGAVFAASTALLCRERISLLWKDADRWIMSSIVWKKTLCVRTEVSQVLGTS